MPATVEQLNDKELDKALKNVSKLMFGMKLDKDYKTHAKMYSSLLREKGHRAKKQCGQPHHSAAH